MPSGQHTDVTHRRRLIARFHRIFMHSSISTQSSPHCTAFRSSGCSTLKCGVVAHLFASLTHPRTHAHTHTQQSSSFGYVWVCVCADGFGMRTQNPSRPDRIGERGNYSICAETPPPPHRINVCVMLGMGTRLCVVNRGYVRIHIIFNV